jgi:hypothetical protein
MNHSLSTPINVVAVSPRAIFERSYEIFVDELKDKANRPKLFGKFLYIDERVGGQGKEEGYWHLASIGEDDTKFDMYPCQNHEAYSMCDYLCEAEHKDNFLRGINSIPCIYRAHKINWVKEIIELANRDPDHPNIRIWRQKTKRDKRLKIRYINTHIDYVLIFAIVYNDKRSDIRMYKLITAYPVVLKSYKKRFDREYEEEQEKKK